MVTATIDAAEELTNRTIMNFSLNSLGRDSVRACINLFLPTLPGRY